MTFPEFYDRNAAARSDLKLVRAEFTNPAAKLLMIEAGSTTRDHTGRHLQLLPLETYEYPLQDLIYLGRLGQQPIFCVSTAAPAEGDWHPALTVAQTLTEPHRELFFTALALTNWHSAAGYAPLDGTATVQRDAGWARQSASGELIFPRTDPAVIVRIEHEDKILLGSNALWQPGRFSMLAGFIEAGETAEQAVLRETFEECGLRVADPRFLKSQAWPFPRSLMLGFSVHLAPGTDPDSFVPQTDEIAALRWFSRAEIVSPPAGVTLPGKATLARWLLDNWVEQGSGAAI